MHNLDQEDVGPSASFDRPSQVSFIFNLLWKSRYKTKNSLTSVLHDANWRTFWGCGLVLLIASLANFMVPVSLSALLDCIADIDDDKHDGEYYQLFGLDYGQVGARIMPPYS